ncbi:MAG: CbbQ/NirQ/NorQ C-terminal domain-containing protein [Candidatus Competibacteraceae bacterium]|nr:CbbQ/NirQ/NorQ C-terminal domain-containing protein [Candidatus Competibacteraceae bacterium]MCB1803738.1 CbbQ/NirQ/NorQ C-terminal domain-containing protein [Candidatus Competibacteraceae bacterium]MCB1810165.1 CbbQ/NirQ/NorQ C-terminal domain-containing protein [Candidatus Competibacteraceae bacterium]
MTKTITHNNFPVAQTFGIQAPEKLTVPGHSRPGPLTPKASATYRFRSEALSDVLCWHKGLMQDLHHDGLWMTGPMGAGKSSLIVEVAARLNLNVVQVNAKRRLEISDLIGHNTLLGGDVLFQDGPLTTALRNGWWLLLNEADLVDPGELAGLNTVLDGGPLVIPDNGGEVVYPTPGFGLIGTANTVGLGDSAGLYVGTQRLNAALLDRFWVIEVDYPRTPDEQAILLQAAPGLPAEIIDKMIEVANEVRRLFKGEADGASVEITFSTRTLIRWAYLVQQYRTAPQPMQYALMRALTQRAEPETAAAIHGIVQRLFGETAEQEVHRAA